MSFNQYEPYGPVVETTVRIVTWNVWGRYGDWEQRQEVSSGPCYERPPTSCAWSSPGRQRMLGVLPPHEPQLSDHYGVIADLRY